MRALMEDNHEDERGRRRLAEQADSLSEELLASGVLERLPEPDPFGRTLQLAPALQDDFALNQPLASFAQAAFDLIDPEAENYALDVLSVVESILDDPFPVLMAQANKARGEAVAAMKADGIEYEERMALLEEVTYPQPLAEPLEQALRLYRETHPWVLESDLSPKSVVRDMYEWGRTFTEFVAFYGVARSEGLVLRYLSDTYRALRQTVPEQRQDRRARRHHRVARRDGPPDRLEPPGRVGGADRPGVGRTRRGRRGRRRGARAAAPDHRQRARLRGDDPQRDVPEGAAGRPRTASPSSASSRPRRRPLIEEPARVVMNAAAWESALGAYWDEYETMDAGPAARAPGLLLIDRAPAGGEARTWTVRQILDDPDGQPRLGDRRHGRPRCLRRRRRAGDPHRSRSDLPADQTPPFTERSRQGDTGATRSRRRVAMLSVWSTYRRSTRIGSGACRVPTPHARRCTRRSPGRSTAWRPTSA